MRRFRSVIGVWAAAAALGLGAVSACSGGDEAAAGSPDAAVSAPDATGGGGSDASTVLDATSPDGAAGDAAPRDAAMPFDAGGCFDVDPDDGTARAASLTVASVACSFDATKQSWAAAMESCARRGAGWRLPTKQEALKLLADPTLCRSGADAAAAPIGWTTWTTTCAGRERVWVVGGSGSASIGRTDIAPSLGFFALCMR
jgi:hypothetical protein